MNTNDIEIVHVLPGRVRLKIPRIKQDSDFRRQVERQFGTVKGIERVDVHPLTGSVVVQFDPERITHADSLIALSQTLSSLFPKLDVSPGDFEAIAKPASKNEADSDSSASADTSGSTPLHAFTASLNTKVADITGGLDIKTVLPLAFTALAVRELLVGKNLRFPSWYDFLWFSFASHHMLNKSSANESTREVRKS